MRYNSMAELDAAYMRGEIDVETYDMIGMANKEAWDRRDMLTFFGTIFGIAALVSVLIALLS